MDPHAPEGDDAMSPEASMELIARERRRAGQRLVVNPTPIFALWGATFLIGWGACYFAVRGGPGGFPPVWAAITVLAVLYVAAIALPIVLGVRASRGVRGPSRMTGTMFGWAWALSFAALAAVNSGLIRQGLSAAAISLLWSGTALLLTGVMYLAAGMLWRDRAQYALGAWMLLSAAGSVYAGYPGDFLVLALAGGGGFLLWALFWALTGRGRR